MENLKKLIDKYRKDWNKNGMGSGISYSKLISELEEINCGLDETKAVGQNEKSKEICQLCEEELTGNEIDCYCDGCEVRDKID